MSELRQEIENRFALQTDSSAYSLHSLDSDYPGWVIRSSDGEYGVIIKYEGEPISESFSGAYLYSQMLSLTGVDEGLYLVLSCKNNNLRNQFSALCEDFLSPGDNGDNRIILNNNPLKWWMKWRELLGNRQAEDTVYDIVAELYTLKKLCETGRTDAYWTASQMNTHDIEMPDMSYEVKSSVQKEITSIHISSQFQLKSEMPLFLVFVRLEESMTGDSIDDLLAKVSYYQYENAVKYNDYLEQKGLKPGNHSRKRKFKILEARRYLIDKTFPLIKDEMFVTGRLPDHVRHLEYDIILDGINYENWK